MGLGAQYVLRLRTEASNWDNFGAFVAGKRLDVRLHGIWWRLSVCPKIYACVKMSNAS